MRPNHWIAAGALSGALTVALGAFGAHALEGALDADDLEVWHTAVQYQGTPPCAIRCGTRWR